MDGMRKSRNSISIDVSYFHHGNLVERYMNYKQKLIG